METPMFTKGNLFFTSSYPWRVTQITKMIFITIITVQFKCEKHFLSRKMMSHNAGNHVSQGLEFQMFLWELAPKNPRGTCCFETNHVCYASIIQFSCLISSSVYCITFSNDNLGSGYLYRNGCTLCSFFCW